MYMTVTEIDTQNRVSWIKIILFFLIQLIIFQVYWMLYLCGSDFCNNNDKLMASQSVSVLFLIDEKVAIFTQTVKNSCSHWVLTIALYISL